MIDKLTPEQEALIPVYREKWRAIALSTEPINREKAADAVKAIYAAIGQQEPKIIFFDSPCAAHQNLLSLGSLPYSLYDLIRLEVRIAIKIILGSQLNIKLWEEIGKLFTIEFDSCFSIQIGNEIIGEITEEEAVEIEAYFWGVIMQEDLAEEASIMDYCISGLTLSSRKSQYKWELYQSLAENCGWIYTLEEICYVCDRPRILSLDSQQRLHAEGSPAIQFADGFSVYAYHGVRLPEKYGKFHPQQWRSEWLLSEDNAELRRVLIQGIGYDRICQELAAVELDTWQQYTLLKIDNNVDIEAIYLLKMTCPSTGYLHVLRVPPDVESAREAIRWVNWGIDPEEFAVQT
ncbi:MULTISPECIES: DUF6745 domain-containing protein [Kamptonema]|uniref:DUF6745 domain-containing protein n=1 Tax=Kamptonema TaxID=1501433 RepID=UPI0001DAD07D|nr:MULTISPECIES: hypothetical protein [Kamptonema]CBN57022.1 conserved hypothetical protein [Kamptonema sp. PCC 6506]